MRIKVIALWVWVFGASWVWLASGCISHVRLPERPLYPSGGGASTPESLIRAKVQKQAPALWRAFAAFWGVRRLHGRMWLQLFVQHGRLKRCALRRSELHARSLSREQQARQREHLRRSMHQGRQASGQLCAILKKLPWPEHRNPKVLTVDVVLTQVVVKRNH